MTPIHSTKRENILLCSSSNKKAIFLAKIVKTLTEVAIQVKLYNVLRVNSQ